MSRATFLRLCLLPLAAVVMAFFVLPMARLAIVGASGETGLRAYAAILLEPRYRATLINTVLLAASTTAATLVNRAQRFICERRQYQATLWLRHHQPSNPPPAR